MESIHHYTGEDDSPMNSPPESDIDSVDSPPSEDTPLCDSDFIDSDDDQLSVPTLNSDDDRMYYSEINEEGLLPEYPLEDDIDDLSLDAISDYDDYPISDEPSINHSDDKDVEFVEEDLPLSEEPSDPPDDEFDSEIEPNDDEVDDGNLRIATSSMEFPSNGLITKVLPQEFGPNWHFSIQNNPAIEQLYPRAPLPYSPKPPYRLKVVDRAAAAAAAGRRTQVSLSPVQFNYSSTEQSCHRGVIPLPSSSTNNTQSSLFPTKQQPILEYEGTVSSKINGETKINCDSNSTVRTGINDIAVTNNVIEERERGIDSSSSSSISSDGIRLHRLMASSTLVVTKDTSSSSTTATEKLPRNNNNVTTIQMLGDNAISIEHSSSSNTTEVTASLISRTENTVLLSQHPIYRKYVMLVNVGVPRAVVIEKMLKDGLDPWILQSKDVDLAGTKISLDEPVKQKSVAEVISSSAAVVAVKGMGNNRKSARTKKMHLKGVDASKVVGRDSLWASSASDLTAMMMMTGGSGENSVVRNNNDDDDILVDTTEFERLFVAKDRDDDDITTTTTTTAVDTNMKILIDDDNDEGGEAGGRRSQSIMMKSPVRRTTTISLIDPKRAQNAAIALARLKISFDNLRLQLLQMDDCGLTCDQLLSLREYLPTIDEQRVIQKYMNNDRNHISKDSSGVISNSAANNSVNLLRSQLGTAEQYMLTMIDVDNASDRIDCLLFKQQFGAAVHECKVQLNKLETACEEVKNSVRLKKVLRVALKVGNQLNASEVQHAGLTLDALLKLQHTKALDKKTSVLHYIVTLIYRNDPDALLFPEQDLASLREVSKIMLDNIRIEKNRICKEYEKHSLFVQTLVKNNYSSNSYSASSSSSSNDRSLSSTIVDFYKQGCGNNNGCTTSTNDIDGTKKAQHQCDDLEKRFHKVQLKYVHLLSYFGEEVTMSTEEFFSALSAFIQGFVTARDQLYRHRKIEATAARNGSKTTVRRSQNNRNNIINGNDSFK